MKYLKIDPFEKHLEEALPDHPSQLYFILMEDPFERRHLAERIAMRLGIPLTSCESDELLLQLESPSMFAEKGVIICDEVAAKELPLGEEWVVIVTGIKPPPFFKKLEKEAVTLDLTGEKPWDRKSRLQRWLLEHAREKRKTLAVDAAAYLVEFSHTDFALLFQELEKALVYAGEEKTVTLEMIKTNFSVGNLQVKMFSCIFETLFSPRCNVMTIMVPKIDMIQECAQCCWFCPIAKHFPCGPRYKNLSCCFRIIGQMVVYGMCGDCKALTC